MVGDDLGPIRPQIVLFGIQSKALGDMLGCGLRGVVVQPRPCMIGKPKFVVPVVSEKDLMGHCSYPPFLQYVVNITLVAFDPSHRMNGASETRRTTRWPKKV
jgi:hypothetical protein